MAQTSSDTWKFVGCHANPDPRAADQNPSIDGPGDDSSRDGFGKIREIAGLGRMRAAIQRLDTLSSQKFGNLILHRESGMVTSDCVT
jgi:hypothetical protein